MSKKELKERIIGILNANISLHSIRSGQGVFVITSIGMIADQILAIIEESKERPPVLSKQRAREKALGRLLD